MKMTSLDFGFMADYQLRVLTPEEAVGQKIEEWSEDGLRETTTPGGLILSVMKTKGEVARLMSFSGFHDSYSSANGVYACPSPDHFIVVEGGTAFYVDVRPGGAVLELSFVVPVVRVERSLEAKLIIVCSFSNIAVVGCAGLLWQSQDIVTDDLMITKVLDGNIYGLGGFYLHGEEPESFCLSVKDGSGRVYSNRVLSTTWAPYAIDEDSE